jgi:hypothetical protein
MVEDLIKRLRDDAGLDGQKLLAADLLEQQAARIAELTTCKLCNSTGNSTPCAYPTEINRQQARRLTALESERDALLAAAGKEAVAHKFALIRDRNYDGEGLSLWTWNGENYSGADGDCLSPDPDGTLDGYTTEWLTDYQLEQRLNATAPTAALENGDGRDAERYRAARTSAYVLGIRNPTPEEFDALVDGLIDVMAQQQGGT